MECSSYQDRGLPYPKPAVGAWDAAAPHLRARWRCGSWMIMPMTLLSAFKWFFSIYILIILSSVGIRESRLRILIGRDQGSLITLPTQVLQCQKWNVHWRQRTLKLYALPLLPFLIQIISEETFICSHSHMHCTYFAIIDSPVCANQRTKRLLIIHDCFHAPKVMPQCCILLPKILYLLDFCQTDTATGKQERTQWRTSFWQTWMVHWPIWKCFLKYNLGWVNRYKLDLTKNEMKDLHKYLIYYYLSECIGIVLEPWKKNIQ